MTRKASWIADVDFCTVNFRRASREPISLTPRWLMLCQSRSEFGEERRSQLHDVPFGSIGSAPRSLTDLWLVLPFCREACAKRRRCLLRRAKSAMRREMKVPLTYFSDHHNPVTPELGKKVFWYAMSSLRSDNAENQHGTLLCPLPSTYDCSADHDKPVSVGFSSLCRMRPNTGIASFNEHFDTCFCSPSAK